MTAEKSLPTAVDAAAFDRLLQSPESNIQGTYQDTPYAAKIAIPNYGERIERHFKDVLRGGLARTCALAEIPFNLFHFGLVVSFAGPVEIAIHDEEMVLDEAVEVPAVP